jgi:exodeoxyribonuclease VIII
VTGQIRSRVPADEYHALPGVGITRLKELKRSGLHYQYRLANPKTTVPLVLGTAAHCAVLEPERFTRQFAVWRRRSENTGNLCPRNGKHWEEFRGANFGRDVITEDEELAALGIAKAVRSDPRAMRYLEQGDPEVTLQWETGIESMLGAPALFACKGRVDWLTHLDGVAYLVGLKSARDARPLIFGTAAARLQYHLQWAFYLDGYQAITSKVPKVKEIVVESEPPHDVVVFDIPEDVVYQGRDEYQALLRHLRQCEERGEWLGCANGTEQVLTLPTWAYPHQGDDLSDLGLE